MTTTAIFHPKGGVNLEPYNRACKEIKDRAKKQNFLFAGTVKPSTDELSWCYGYIYQINMDEFELCLLPGSHLEYPSGQIYFESMEEIESWAASNKVFVCSRTPSITEALAFTVAHDKSGFKEILQAL